MKYSNVTQRTIQYIEEHLTSSLYLDDFSELVGYSKYHLTRIFKQETGLAISEYIRVRRLAVAAMLLMHTTESISTLQLSYSSSHKRHLLDHFESCMRCRPVNIEK